MKRKLFLITIISAFIFSFCACSCKKEVTKEQAYVDGIMGYKDKSKQEKVYNFPFNTVVSLVYFNEKDKDKVFDYFNSEFTRLHSLFDRHYYYFDGDTLINNLRVINESNGEAITVDDDLINILKEGIRFTKLSDGKFNIGVGNLSDLWDGFIGLGTIDTNVSVDTKYSLVNGNYVEDNSGKYILYRGVYINVESMTINGDGTIRLKDISPSAEQISEALACTPSASNIDSVIVLNETNKRVTINQISGCNGNVSITLGALAKSYAAEKVAADKNMQKGDFLINAGQSTIKIIGKNLLRDNGAWKVGISDSYLTYKRIQSGFPSYVMELDNEYSVSTSSGDENHFYSGDHYYHHIINPASGYPNENRLAVTAIGSNAMYCDIVTTALMSMNASETAAFISKLNEANINLEFFIQEKGEDKPRLLASEGMKRVVSITESEELNEYLESLTIEDL